MPKADIEWTFDHLVGAGKQRDPLLSSFGGEIESKDAFVIAGPFQHFGVPKRAAGIDARCSRLQTIKGPLAAFRVED